jgi:hypothetical protein
MRYSVRTTTPFLVLVADYYCVYRLIVGIISTFESSHCFKFSWRLNYRPMFYPEDMIDNEPCYWCIRDPYLMIELFKTLCGDKATHQYLLKATRVPRLDKRKWGVRPLPMPGLYWTKHLSMSCRFLRQHHISRTNSQNRGSW